MKAFISMALVIIGCGQSSKSVQQQVFDDYLLLHFKSWNDAKGRNYVPDFYYEPGDTIRLQTKLSMLIIPNDTETKIVLDDKNNLELDSGTLITFISEAKNSSVGVMVNINDSTFKGILSTNAILEAELGETHLNTDTQKLVEQLAKFKKDDLTELSTKYNLSKDSILHLISDEYFRRTGRRGTNY
jgi:hypothetical protein